MRAKELFLIVCCTGLLLAACQNTPGLPAGSTKDGEQVARLIDGKTSSHSGVLDEFGGVIPAQEETGTPTTTPSAETSSTSTATPAARPSTATSGACAVRTEGNRTVYDGPGTGYSIVGQLEPGRDYLVTGMYYRTDFPTWWRIDYGPREGWVSGLGALTNFMPGASCTPPVELVDIDPPPGAPEACTVNAPVARTLYAGPGTGYPVLGQIEPERKYLVTGMYYATNYPTWWRIDYGGADGWIDGQGNYTNFMPGASCNPPVEIIDVNLPPAATPWPTPQMQPGACYVAPVDETSNLQVYAGPAYSYPVMGSTQPGRYYLATGQLPLDLPDRFIQIDYNGTPGWVDASRYMFNGDGCWPIPTLSVWPTPMATSTPLPAPTISPTSTLEPGVGPNQVTYISSTIGTTTQITGALPTTDGKTTTAVAIRVNFGPQEVGPYDGVRMLNVLVQCTGVNPQNLRWGYYGSEANIECGRYIDTGVSQGGNLLVLALAVPSDGMTAAYYTITMTVNAP